LYGSNLAPAGPIQEAGIPFPTTGLGGVQVSIGGLPAPIFYVLPGQISVIVPYGVTGPIAQIQVTNNGVLSNVVTAYLRATAPGVFTLPPGGPGYGAILHQDGVTVVTAANPALTGETISLYLTGLGAVSPTIADGAAAPTTSLVNTTASYSVYFYPTGAAPLEVTPGFAGLAPGFSGLYQLNVTVPPGLAAGDNFIVIEGPEPDWTTYMEYKLLPVSTTTYTSTSASTDVTAALAPVKPQLRRPSTGRPRKQDFPMRGSSVFGH
jgi:uncharacterized protein (TIGR03437 family)